MDSVHPNGRPLTIPEMFDRLAVMARQTNDLESLLPGIDHVRQSVEIEIDRQRPGWSMDRLLGLARTDYQNGERK